MYLERRANAPVPRFRRVGIGIAPDGAKGLLITGVLPNSPASDAGLAVGDHVLTVGGIAAHMTAAQFLASVRGPVGARITMRVSHGGTERTVTLVLRELLCEHPAPCSPRVKKSRAPLGT
jgi:S1-C subfamily serine protease